MVNLQLHEKLASRQEITGTVLVKTIKPIKSNKCKFLDDTFSKMCASVFDEDQSARGRATIGVTVLRACPSKILER
jgi:hypothetical protein